jgi:hypothetical protein
MKQKYSPIFLKKKKTGQEVHGGLTILNFMQKISNILCLVGCYSTSNQNLVIQHAMEKGLFFMQQSELKHVNFHTLRYKMYITAIA